MIELFGGLLTNIKLLLSAVIPALATAFFMLLNRFTPFKKLPNTITKGSKKGTLVIKYFQKKPGTKYYSDFGYEYNRKDVGKEILLYHVKQLIIGCVFGIIAILATVYGVPYNDYVANCRDAAPLAAGMFFGAPAGIIAGLIGGIYRWFYGGYTAGACAFSTCLSGFYAGLLRAKLFDDHKPGWGVSVMSAVCMEIIHLSMVFFTHMGDAVKASQIIYTVTFPLVFYTALSVLLSRIAAAIAGREHIGKDKNGAKHISVILQKKLLIAIVVAVISINAVFLLVEINLANNDTYTVINNYIDGLQTTVEEAMDSGADIDEIETYKVLAGNIHLGNHGTISLFDNRTGNKFYGTIPANNLAEYNEICKTVANIDGFGLVQSYSLKTVTIDGERYFALAKNAGLVTITGVYKISDAYYYTYFSIFINIFLETLVFCMLFIQLFSIVKKTITDKVEQIGKELSSVVKVELKKDPIKASGSIEINTIASGVNEVVNALSDKIEAEKKRIAEELEFAKHIQASSLPSIFPAFPNRSEFDIHAIMRPAKEVGGDFYDFYFSENDVLAFLVADVSGKGIPAAMFMMRSKTVLKALATQKMELGEAFAMANSALCEGNDSQMFVTCWMGKLNIKTGELEYANAGHNPPVRISNSENKFMRDISGMVLAGIEGLPYKTFRTKLEPGESILVYTDGVTEATNANNELFGEARLMDFVSEAKITEDKAFCEELLQKIDEFDGNAPQFDDITMLALTYYGRKSFALDFETVSGEDINVITPRAEAFLEELGCPIKNIYEINIAIDEIYSNIVKYAYPDKLGPATFSMRLLSSKNGIEMVFTDCGIPYNPLNCKAPDINSAIEDRGIGGNGIYMVRKMMTEVKYLYENDKNILKVRKNFEKG